MLRANEKRGSVSAQASTSISVALPPKVQAVIQSRLAQLSPSARELAELAATVGRAFTVEVLTRAGDSDEDNLVRALDELWRRRLIREQGDNTYDFSHDRIREGAYTSISSARRHLLHRRVAQALEQLHGPELDSISGELAKHYKCAGLLDQALQFYQMAAAVAQRIYAHDEARSHLVKVLEILKNQPVSRERLQQELVAYLSLTTTMTVLKGVSSSEANVISIQAYELAVQVGDIPQRYSALAARVATAVCRGELAEALDLANQRLALVKEVGDASQQATARGRLGVIELCLGHWTTARTFLEQGLDRASDRSFYSASMVPIQHLGLSCHRHLPFALWHLGYPDQAVEQMNEALTRSDRLSHPYTTSMSYTYAAWLHQYRGEISLVQARAEIAIALCLEYGFTYNLQQCYILQGWVLTQQGQVEAGMAQMRKSIAMRETMDARIHQPAFLAFLAEVYGQVGQPDVGLRLLDEAMDMVNASEMRWPETELYRLQGELLHMQGADGGVVESHLLQALAIARQQEAKSPELRVALSLGRLWQEQGRSHEAHTLLAGIYGWFGEGFDTRDLVEARALLGELA
jgi:tetratricopeptide (TPR) repeat protein